MNPVISENWKGIREATHQFKEKKKIPPSRVQLDMPFYLIAC